MTIKSHRDLNVWQTSMTMVEELYAVVRQFPCDERYELSAQMRRAAVSIPSNIAEGYGCGTTGRYLHHLRIALGSNAELETQLELTQRLKLASPAMVEPLRNRAAEVGRMLNGLIRALARQRRVPHPSA